MRSMVEGVCGEPTTSPPPPPTQPSLRRLRKLACVGGSPPPPRGGDEVGQHERTWLGRSPAMRQMIEEAARPQRVTTTVVPTLTRL